MKKLKVLIVSDYYLPHWTGIAKCQYYFTKLLHDAFDYTVLTVKHEKGLAAHESIEEVEVIREPYVFSLSRAKFSARLIFKFMSLCPKYDRILINSPSIHILPLALIAKMRRKPFLILHHGDLILPKGLFNRGIEALFDMFSHIAFRLAHKVSTFTRDYAQHSRVLRPYLHKFTPIVVPLKDIDTSPKEMLPQVAKLKKEGKIVLGFAGRFVEEKGFDILFKAIPQVAKAIPAIHFVFAGEVHMQYEHFYEQNEHELQKVKQYVTMLGKLNTQDLQSFYQSIEYIVLPSRSDCFPLVQVEAMLQGTPAIVSDIPGARVPVAQTHFGSIFAKEDANALAKTIIDAVKNRSTIINYRKNVLLFFDLKTNEKRIEAFIRD